MNPLTALWERLIRDPKDNRRSVGTSASDALRAAERAAPAVSRAVGNARRTATRTDTFVREMERSLHQKGKPA